jgi:putative photosynthetic complex assembly protein 2
MVGLPFLGAGIYMLAESLHVAGIGGAYAGFFAALLIWGWIELAFLTGIITGPAPRDCPPGVVGFERFLRAWGTVAYHEMLLTVTLVLVAYASWEAENMFSFWTFAVLYFARISAKLNLFFGVPKINVEFLPSPLSHLPSHFKRASMNGLFPLSITALTFAVACWLERIWSAGTPAEAAGFALLAALTGLALLEHWLMVLPLPDEKLWRWMIPAPKQQNDGLLGEDRHGL